MKSQKERKKQKEKTQMIDEFQSLLIPTLQIVLTGLVSWVVARLIAWLNSKIKDKKVASYLSSITEIVGMSVKEVFQTYVEALKKGNVFTEECQKEALNRALTKCKECLNDDILAYIVNTYGDVEKYLTSKIESMIYSLKTTGKEE